MPITRYATHLKLRGEYDRYLELLANNFNGATLDQVMCRNLISVGWEGLIYDCDFNQMLNLPIRDRSRQAASHQLAIDRTAAQSRDYGRRSLLCLYRRRGQQLRRHAGLAHRASVAARQHLCRISAVLTFCSPGKSNAS